MRFLCALLTLCCISSAAAGGSLSDLRGLRTKGSRFPIYHKEHLQIMLYSSGTERNGNLIAATDPVMDIIRRGADVDDVASGGKAVRYSLNAPLPEIFAFWSKRLYSEGVIFSSKADIDQENRLAGGSDKVYFRSPTVDLDGVGFDANYEKRTVLVKKDVNIVLRMKSSDPAEIVRKGGKLPEKYEFLTASCDSMFLDFTKNEIYLMGNVKVNEERAIITCDKMTVFLDRGKNRKSAASDDITGGVSGVSRILCEGNVVITRPGSDGRIPSDKASLQQGRAEKVNYRIDNGLITMTGNQTVQPVLEQGGNQLYGDIIEIHRDRELMNAAGNCRIKVTDTAQSDGKVTTMTSDKMSMDYRNNHGWFTGNVNVKDKENTLTCPRMKVTLRPRPQAKLSKKEDSSLMPGFNTGAKRELDKIYCMDNVSILHNPPEQTSAARITARRCTYELSTGAVLFEEDVKIRDPRMNVDCDKMKVFTVADGKAAEKSRPVASSAGGRRLERIECFGNVHARDAKGHLYSDEAKLFFEKASGKPEMKMQLPDSGSSELVKITCDGNVKMKNIPSSAGKNSAKKDNAPLSGMFKRGSTQPMLLTADRGMADLRKDRSEFHGNVKVREEQTELDCQSLFLQAAKAPQGALKPLKVLSADEEIDRDPLALQEMTDVPSQLNIGEGRELKEVIAVKDVVMRRILENGKKQTATGDRAHYTVADRTVVLTGSPEKPPVLHDPEQGKMSGRYVIVDLAREQMYVKEDTSLDFKGFGAKNR